MNLRPKPSKSNSAQIGAEAEKAAIKYLQKQGVRVLAKNVACRGGEVDVIAEHENVVIFVEIRLRSNTDFGGAGASITNAKQQRVRLAAQYWLTNEGRTYAQRPCRFDALLFDSPTSDWQWLQGAF